MKKPLKTHTANLDDLKHIFWVYEKFKIGCLVYGSVAQSVRAAGC